MTEQPVRGAERPLHRMRPAARSAKAIGKIDTSDPRTNFTGYADKAATEKKILRDVFETGDAWFRTGDLMRQDADGYFYFVDRIGDTFRWKGENVSTGEVADQLLARPRACEEANVYGVAVPRQDGTRRHGRPDGRTTTSISAAFYAHVEAKLPPYARPLFLRLQRQD